MKLISTKKHLAATAFIAVFCAASIANAGIITQWTVETPTTPADTTAATGPSVSASTGTGTLNGVHAASSAWTTPSGNGSAESYSVNTWAVGDYYQIQTSTLGSSNIGLQFDQTSSNTGPRDFKVQYFDGTNYVDAGYTYAVLANASPNPTWNATTSSAIYTNFVNLSAIVALNNSASISLRLVDTSTVSANGGTVAAAGTSRLDNVSVFDNVPEPSCLFLAIAAVMAIGGYRRGKV